MLKLDEIRGQLEGEDAQRWADIKRTFKRNLLLGAAGDDGQLGKVIAQMSTFSEGLSDIRSSLDKGIKALGKDQNEDADVVIQTATMQQIAHGVEELSKFNTTLDQIKNMMGQGIKTSGIAPVGEVQQQKIEVVNKVPHIFLAIIRDQFRVLQTWMDPILKIAEVLPEGEGLKKAVEATRRNYDKVAEQLEDEELE